MKTTDKKFENVVLIAVLFAIDLIALFLFIRRGLYSQACDFKGQWVFCAYTLRGIDSLSLIGNEVSVLDDIGIVSKEFNTSPWGLILGNLFYPGFLSLKALEIYFPIATAVFVLLTSIAIYYKFAKKSKPFAIITTIAFLFCQNIMAALFGGNGGGIMSCLLIISCLWYKDFPIISGIALGFAMTKPQLAALFALSFLLKKQYKLIFTAASLDIASWGIASILTKTSPLALLKSFLSAGVAQDMEFMGIFSPISYWLTGTTKNALFVSMLFGIIFVAGFCFFMKKKELEKNSTFYFYPACFATVFWCYTRGYDRAILIIPAFYTLFLLYNSERRMEKLLFFCMSAYLMFERLIITLLYQVMKKAIYGGSLFVQETANSPLLKMTKLYNTYATSLYTLGLIVLAVLLLIKINRTENENTPRI